MLAMSANCWTRLKRFQLLLKLAMLRTHLLQQLAEPRLGMCVIPWPVSAIVAKFGSIHNGMYPIKLLSKISEPIGVHKSRNADHPLMLCLKGLFLFSVLANFVRTKYAADGN